MTKLCVSKEKIEAACYSAALSLGYSLKDEQREISSVLSLEVTKILAKIYDENRKLKFNYIPSVQMRDAR